MAAPAFVDLPLDHAFGEGPESPAPVALPDAAGGPAADGEALERAIALLRDARRPVVMAGTDLYWGHGEDALRELAEQLRIPVFLNGLARGCLPADHELFFSRARREALREADVALVVGAPMDFRLGFGGVFGEEHLADRRRPCACRARGAPARRSRPSSTAGSARRCRRCAGAAGRDAGGADRAAWVVAAAR